MVKPFEIVFVVVVAVVAYWLGTLSNSNTTRTAGAGKRIDPATGIEFSESQSFHISKNLSLLGVGTRKKAILNVYSLGFFVSKPIQKQLVGQEGASICKTILESSSAGPKAVELIFSMGIGPEKIAEAISQLKTVDPQVLEEFQTMLIQGMGEGKMKKGESFTFEWKGSDAITATARGKFIGQVKDKALATGVLGLYVGPDSVSPSLRRDLGCI